MSDEPSSSGVRFTTRQRRRARMLAFQTLYEVDISSHRPAEVLERLTGELNLDGAVAGYASELVAGVARHRGEIDELIARFAPAWPVGQMAAIDRNVLRLGIFEAVYNSTTIPVGVAINEAVELAKRYGSENSARFVNGVLGRVVAEHAQDHLPPNHQPGDVAG